MRSVLITGATTPIGRALLRRLARDPNVARVLAVAAEAAPVFDPESQAKLRYLRADLTRDRDLRTLMFGPMAELGVDTVIHTVLHRSALDEGRGIHVLNVESTRAMIRLAQEHPTLRRFVFRSSAEVYRIDEPCLIGEEHPVAIGPSDPEWLRDRIEADLTVCAHIGISSFSIAVLRCAECPVRDSGSQLFAYLSRKRCFRPAGFDPLLNLVSLPDLVRALQLALHSNEPGIFNIPGKDTLPLSRVIALAGRRDVSMPSPLLSPIERLRSVASNRTSYRYDLNRRRFHFGQVLDGRRAERLLGYRPENFIDWDALRRELATPEKIAV